MTLPKLNGKPVFMLISNLDSVFKFKLVKTDKSTQGYIR